MFRFSDLVIESPICRSRCLGRVRPPDGYSSFHFILSKRDECEHSQNSGRLSITRLCHNRGPAKDEAVPTPFGDGDKETTPHHPTAGLLQWGHRFRRWRCGHRGHWPVATVAKLQWGQRLSANGDHPHRQNGQTRRPASMGPTPFGDGDLGQCARANVPAFLLQWGHRLSAMEIIVDTAYPCWSCARFNGATAFRRWRSSCRAPADPGGQASMGPPPFGDGDMLKARWQTRQGAASMGPPPFGDGDRQDSRAFGVCAPRFNGATAFRQWRCLGLAT